jgi:phosphoserine phosphatase
MVSAVIFDLDGTLTKTPSPWQYVHQRLGFWDDPACHYLSEWQAGHISYDEFCRRDARLWNGRTVREIEALLDEIDFNRHVHSIVQNLTERRVPSIIISSGFRYVAAKIQTLCSWDPLIIHANDLVEGPEVQINVSGDFSSPISKRALALETLKSVGADWSETLVVSDTTRDLEQLGDCHFKLHVQQEDDLLRVNDYFSEP